MHTHYTLTDGRKFLIGTMYCIGKNYAAHAREMGGEVPASPMVFLKPPAAYLPSGSSLPLPSFSHNVHHEVELVILIGKDCADITEEQVPGVIAGYAVGLDMTLRDIQAQAKQKGEPWAIAKGFRGAAPISDFIPSDGTTIADFDVYLTVNGAVRQQGATTYMERSVAELVAYLSSVFTLRAGDIVLTGTPEGVSAIQSGDMLHAELRTHGQATSATLAVLDIAIA
jgi:2-keto-4-pentenoate hydratase/2-oxohepta-3-ene-1,7-dioic acid hydratase in catechol pathway